MVCVKKNDKPYQIYSTSILNVLCSIFLKISYVGCVKWGEETD